MLADGASLNTRRIFSYIIIIVAGLFFCFKMLERKFGFFWHISGKMFTAAVKLWKVPLFLLGFPPPSLLHSKMNCRIISNTSMPSNYSIWGFTYHIGKYFPPVTWWERGESECACRCYLVKGKVITAFYDIPYSLDIYELLNSTSSWIVRALE